jgi:hypothetical protein
VGNPAPDPLPYADPKVPSGPTGFEATGYPSDDAGPLEGCVKDDGTSLSLVPGRLNSVGLGSFTVVALVCVIGAIFCLPVPGQPAHAPWGTRISNAAFASFGVLVFYFLLRSPNRDRRPWIVVERESKRILLPRSKRSFSFADVVRLQLVCFSRRGAFAEATGTGRDPPAGELQIVYRESGKEQTWCVVSELNVPAAKQFSVAIHQISGVPVARAIYHPALAEWRVEPFDGDCVPPRGGHGIC